MNENYEKYLPIGTVVMLKGGTKRAMITGFCSSPESEKDKIYDYSGCIYPEGYLSSNQVCLFNHEQIEKIYHMGLVDDEETAFKAKLKNIVSEIEKIGGVQVANTTTVENNSANSESVQPSNEIKPEEPSIIIPTVEGEPVSAEDSVPSVEPTPANTFIPNIPVVENTDTNENDFLG